MNEVMTERQQQRRRSIIAFGGGIDDIESDIIITSRLRRLALREIPNLTPPNQFIDIHSSCPLVLGGFLIYH